MASQLNLHSGGALIDYEALRALETPAATQTHVPIPHHRLVELVRSTLGMYGHEVVEEHHALDHDGMRYFGLMTLKSTYTGYTDTLGLRNSHDRKFPIGIGFGSRVFVCSNLAFVADNVVKRKHTLNAKRELPGLLMEIIEPLAQHREAQHRMFERYKATPLITAQVDHVVMELYRQEVINLQRIPDVMEQFERPSHDWGDPSAYRLFNATTFALNGRVMENSTATPKLHKVIDGVCERV